MASWEHLSAFADGELSREQAATLADALAHDPDGLRNLADILRLKRRLRRRRRFWRRALPVTVLAASAVALVLLIRAPAPPAGLADLHAAWAVDPAFQEAAPLALPAPPDLEAAGLTLVTLRTVALAGGRTMVHMGWHGTRGCRVSLFAEPGAGVADSPPFHAADAWDWSLAGTSYRLLASGMPPDRFATVAAAAYEALQHGGTPAADTRALMARSRAASAPCLG